MSRLQNGKKKVVSARSPSSQSGADTTLSSRALADLRSDILNLTLKPGARLVFDALREKYGVGLSPLREALSRLEVEKLVVAEEWRGFRVSPLTVGDFYDLTEMRREIEAMAVSKSVARGGERWASELSRAFHAMSEASANYHNLSDAWSERHREFHEALVSECGSPWLLTMRRQLFDHFMRYQRLAPQRVQKGFSDAAGHNAILEAAKARDVEKCASLIRSHIVVLDVIVASTQSFSSEPTS